MNANAKRFSVDEFARIANCIRFQLSRGEHYFLHSFLVKSAPRVLKWFNNGDLHNIESIIEIVGAYTESHIEE